MPPDDEGEKNFLQSVSLLPFASYTQFITGAEGFGSTKELSQINHSRCVWIVADGQAFATHPYRQPGFSAFCRDTATIWSHTGSRFHINLPLTKLPPCGQRRPGCKA